MYSQHICRLFVILFWESHMNFVAVLSEIQFLPVKQYMVVQGVKFFVFHFFASCAVLTIAVLEFYHSEGEVSKT